MPIDLAPALDPIITRVRPNGTWRKVANATIYQGHINLNQSIIQEHLRGVVLRGVCPIKKGESTTEIAVLDLDDHHAAAGWNSMVHVTRQVFDHLVSKGYRPVAFRSTGGKGVHIYCIWKEPQDAYSVRTHLARALEECGFAVGTKGVVEGEIEIFPKQNSLKPDGAGSVGNQFILPLAGKSVPLDPLFDFAPMPKEHALQIKWEFSEPVPPLVKPEIQPPAEPLQLYNGKLEPIADALSVLDPDTDYTHWLKIGMGLHHDTGGSQEGFDLWDDWSARAPDRYPGHEHMLQKWHSFSSDRPTAVTTDTIKALAREKGWEEDHSIDFENISTPEDEDRKRRFKLIRADEYLKRPKIEWLIKGILPEHSSGMTYGGSGDGKTFLILDMACAIALGRSWIGHRTRQGKVLYICAEGSGGFITRLQAYCKFHKAKPKELGDWLTILPGAPNFTKPDDVKDLASEVNRNFEKPSLIVIDTLAQTSTGADENSAKDMNVMLHNVARLRDLTKAASHLVHHAGKNEALGARGSSTLKADCDVQFSVSRDGDERRFWVEKMKDYKDNFGWNFNLEPVPLGVDEDGDKIGSCVVKFDENIQLTKKVKMEKRGKWQTIILDVIDKSLCNEISRKDLLASAMEQIPHDGTKRDRREEAFNKAIESLEAENLLSDHGAIIKVPDLSVERKDEV